jgi:hypothetical protein
VFGNEYRDSFTCHLPPAGIGSLDFVLNRTFREFSVTIGFADNSGSQMQEVTFQVVGDGGDYLYQSRTLQFGQTKDISLDVTLISHLSLRVIDRRPGGTGAPSEPVWARPTLTL